MSEIEKLIQKLCPDGVEFKKLGNLVSILRGKRLTKKQLSLDAPFPVFHGGIEPIGFFYQFNRPSGSVMVINVGASAGTVGFCNQNFWSSDGCFCISKESNLLSKYIYYFLQTKENLLKSRVRYAGIPTLDAKSISEIEIPVPPLKVQQRIVEILDNFTSLTAELEAELEARKRQYEYYRNLLLTFNPVANGAVTGGEQQIGDGFTPPIKSLNIRYLSLGEMGTFIRGGGLQKSDFTTDGFPCIHYGQIHTFYKTYAYETISYTSNKLAAKLKHAKYGDLIIATTSEDVDGCCKAVAWLGDNEVAISGDSYIFRHNQNPKYISYLFQTEMFLKYKRMAATGTKVTRVSGDSMKKFVVPIPPLDEQERIVAILDSFETLVNDLTAGLPAEIEARRKQYEYYRNKLLTFKKIA